MNFVMKKKLVFATNNPHKLREINEILSERFEIVSLAELDIREEIPETAETIAGNALQKAQYIYDKTGLNCFADDTGLEVEALDGSPGVYSARYAGENATFDDNMNLLLEELRPHTNRNAKFVTVIALIMDGQVDYFEGSVDGIILVEKRGDQGFGYDPLFLPDGFAESFAEMGADQKNAISHRGRAVQQLASFLLKTSAEEKPA